MHPKPAITSSQNMLVKRLVKLRTDRAYRAQEQTFILEGVKPISEVQRYIVKLFYTEKYADVLKDFQGEAWEVTPEVLQKMSGMKNPEGLIAEVKIPNMNVSEIKGKNVLVFDGISDPGNMGTLLRTALAFGWDSVFLLSGCCDPFNEKTIRAARGAHFKITLVQGSIKNLQEWVTKHNAQSLAADTQGVDPEKVESSDYRVLVLGNEAQGISKEIENMCTKVSLPMCGDMESLNVAVAGGILLYLLSNRKKTLNQL